MNRASGIFLHPTSFPSAFGIGDLGESAYEWIDLVASCNHSFWQLCPLGPTGYGDSPYQNLCSFAGNTLLISPSKLETMGLLTPSDLNSFPRLPNTKVDYGRVIIEKEKLYQKAYVRFSDTDEFREFCEREHYWLDDYALFRVIKDGYGGKPWHLWKASAKHRFPSVLAEIASSERNTIRYHKFLQYIFFIQWRELRQFANSRGVRIIGDIPYYIAYDSSDIWSSPELFELDESGEPTRVAGVPPDYFSETGQLWGNPLYLWDRMREDNYLWWIRRIRKTLEMVDFIRLDHFRGFESYWAVAASSKTAINGEWVDGPGIELFNAIHEAVGHLPVIAEDLGDITPEVEQLRLDAQLPGMKVLQFAFDGNPENPYLPYNIHSRSVIYTGTHDNDTSLGWYTHLSSNDRCRVREYLGCTDDTFVEQFLRAAYNSAAQLCVVPFQDVLGLGSSHRMNTPGQEAGNWQWRYTPDLLSKEKIGIIEQFAGIYHRKAGSDFAFC